MACPECGKTEGQRAGTDQTECLHCGETYQSGLQELAKRFKL